MAQIEFLPHDNAEEAIIAWRVWRVNPFPLYPDKPGDLYFLSSLSNSAPWKPRERFEATCHLAMHTAPKETCTCGIYSKKTDADLRAYMKESHFIYEPALLMESYVSLCLAIGKVSLWGEIVEGETGYRAQYAYPYDITLIADDNRVAQSLREQYQVDVRMDEQWRP